MAEQFQLPHNLLPVPSPIPSPDDDIDFNDDDSEDDNGYVPAGPWVCSQSFYL